MTDAERRDERERIASGEARVVVGARSAVFAPVERLGLICVDEEHDASYKQESDPRYDARTVAAKRAALEGAVAVYGSATPRPESWERLERLELGGRLGRRLPHVQVVDLRREAGYPLSAPLLEELGAISDGGGKAILLLNRRGIAPALHCRACGATRSLPELRRRTHAARGRRTPLPPLRQARAKPRPSVLPAGRRSSPGSAPGRSGSKRSWRNGFPGSSSSASTRTLPRTRPSWRNGWRGSPRRTGQSSSARRWSRRAITSRVSRSQRSWTPTRAWRCPTSAPRSARSSSSPSSPGRSGRDAPGRVLVQTYQPDSRPIALAARHAVDEFLAGEIDRRRELGYPPFRHLVRIVVSGAGVNGPSALLTELRAGLEGADGDLLGPAPLLRLRNRSRAQLLVKTANPRPVASRAARLLAAAAPAMRRDGLTASVDVDPQGLS